MAWTSIWPSHVWTVVSSTVVREDVPALLTRMSSRPKRETANLTASSHSSSLVTSSLTNTASPPDSRIWRAVISPSSSSMSAITTLAPSRAKSHAATPPKPISFPRTPFAAPVIIATLPSSLIALQPTHSNRRGDYISTCSAAR